MLPKRFKSNGLNEYIHVGYVHSSGRTPAWITPVFWEVSKNNESTDSPQPDGREDVVEFLVQESLQGEYFISGFQSYELYLDNSSLGDEINGATRILSLNGYPVESLIEYAQALKCINHNDPPEKYYQILDDIYQNGLIVRVGQTVHYGFQFDKGDVVIGTEEQIKHIFQKRISELTGSPFVFWEVADFINSKKLISKAHQLLNSILSKEEMDIILGVSNNRPTINDKDNLPNSSPTYDRENDFYSIAGYLKIYDFDAFHFSGHSYQYMFRDVRIPEVKSDTTRNWSEVILNNIASDKKRNRRAWLLYQTLKLSLYDHKSDSKHLKMVSDLNTFIKTAIKDEENNYRLVERAQYSTSKKDSDDFEYLTTKHPLVVNLTKKYRDLSPNRIGIRVQSDDNRQGVVSIWQVTFGDINELHIIASDSEGHRIYDWENKVDHIFQLAPSSKEQEPQIDLLKNVVEPMLRQEIVIKGVPITIKCIDIRLMGWIEVVE